MYDLTPIKPITQIGGADLYADGALICWTFECTCTNEGKCETCVTLAGYNMSCKNSL